MLEALMAYLAGAPVDGVWRGWSVGKIGGGANNLLYRAVRDDVDVAVKVTIRDARRRAWREFQALKALAEVGLCIAPKPVLLNETSFPQPVVVQSWEMGDVTAVPPQTDAEWNKLLEHYAALTIITPAKVSVDLPEATVNFASIAAGWWHIQQQMAAIPAGAQPDVLNQLHEALHHVYRHRQEVPANVALCRVDGNTLNFLRRSDLWLSVDWENSGWGDPAFEIVDLMCHPAYLDVSPERWAWVKEQYAAMTGDDTAVSRMANTYPLLLLWWVARLARALYEVPLGKDARLVERADDWQEDRRCKMALYVERLTAVLHTL